MKNSQQSHESLSIEWLKEAHSLIKANNYSALETRLPAALEQGLLSDATLNTARALQLNATVIYLATLGDANLTQSNDRATWLAIYQSISQRSLVSAFKDIPDTTPVKRVAHTLVANASSKVDLDGCETSISGWSHAFELAFDFSRYDVLQEIVEFCAGNNTPTAVWLHVSNSLYKRIQINGQKDISDSDYALSLGHIVKQLPDVKKCRPLRSVLALLTMQALYQCRAYEHCIDIQAMVTQSENYEHAQNIAAMSYAHLNRISEGIACVDNWLEHKLSDKHFEETARVWASRYANRLVRRISGKSFDASDYGRQAFRDVQRIMLKNNIRLFLCGGLLVGYAREGCMLSHDNDLDLGILDWRDQYRIHDAFEKSGLFVFRGNDMHGAESYLMKAYHRPTGIRVDIQIFHDAGDHYILGVDSDFGYSLKMKRSKFALAETEFVGIKTYVPDNIDQYLTEAYGGGDWRLPDLVAGSIIDPIDIIDAGGPIHQLAIRHHIIWAFNAGNLKRIPRLIEISKRYKDHKFHVKPAQLAKLRGLYDYIEYGIKTHIKTIAYLDRTSHD